MSTNVSKPVNTVIKNATASVASVIPKISKMKIAIQIILAIVVILILYIVTLVVLNIDSLISTDNARVIPRETIKIIDGYASVTDLNNKEYNTVTPLSQNFKKIGKSINTVGGAQFSYQFWLKIEDANEGLFKNLVVLLKGDKRKYNLGYYHEMPAAAANGQTHTLVKKLESQYAVAEPLIQFTDSYRDLKVRINTSKNPIVDIDIKMNQIVGPGRQNLLSLLALKSWYMFTFVFVDNFAVAQSAENGIRFMMYVNDVPYVEQNANTMPDLAGNTLKQNDGSLYILPNTNVGGEFLKLGNIKYSNYALSHEDVIKNFKAGPPNHPMVSPDTHGNQPSYISALNKIDINNY